MRGQYPELAYRGIDGKHGSQHWNVQQNVFSSQQINIHTCKLYCLDSLGHPEVTVSETVKLCVMYVVRGGSAVGRYGRREGGL